MDLQNSNINEWPTETILELFRDLFGFEVILEIKRRMKDLEAKNYVSLFLSMIAPVLVYELADSLEKLKWINSKKDFFEPGIYNKVQKERMRVLKSVIVDSKRAVSASEQMGLDFTKKVYDMNIVISGNKLLDMNYETFVDSITDLGFWDSLFGFPKRTINILLNELGTSCTIEQFYEMDDIPTGLTGYANRIDTELCPQKYSYSSYKLFCKSSSLDDIDKFFILYRYRMISSTLLLERLLPPLKLEIKGACIIDIRSYIRKWKAVIIEVLGKELNELKTDFGERIRSEIDRRVIDKSFFPNNRKLRNNAHYQKTEILSSEEISIVDRYQNIYLQTIESIILEQLNISIDEECRYMTSFAKDCSERGLSYEDIKRDYPNNYLSHKNWIKSDI